MVCIKNKNPSMCCLLPAVEPKDKCGIEGCQLVASPQTHPHTQCKQDGSPVMFPKTRGDVALVISFRNKSFFQESLCNDTSLWKTVHAFLYRYLDISIRNCKLLKVVKFDEVLRYVSNF